MLSLASNTRLKLVTNFLGLDTSTGFYGFLILLLPLEATEEDDEDKEVQGSDYEINVYSTVVVVLLELDGIFTLKEEQKTALKAFFSHLAYINSHHILYTVYKSEQMLLIPPQESTHQWDLFPS